MIPKEKIKEGSEAYSAIEIKEGNENDSLFSSRGGMKQLVERSFREGVLFSEKEMKIKIVERLTAMKKNVDLPEFDHSKEKDTLYCVEWGIAKGEWIADAIIDRYIEELK